MSDLNFEYTMIHLRTLSVAEIDIFYFEINWYNVLICSDSCGR